MIILMINVNKNTIFYFYLIFLFFDYKYKEFINICLKKKILQIKCIASFTSSFLCHSYIPFNSTFFVRTPIRYKE